MTCRNLIRSDAGVVYDYASAAGQFSQVNGVLAALVFAALVFILERKKVPGSQFIVPMLLLPMTFSIAILTAYKYSIINSYTICELVSLLAMVAGPSFAFVVLAIVATMASMLQAVGSVSAHRITVALFAATALLSIGNVAITVHQAALTFDVGPGSIQIAWYTGAGLVSTAIAFAFVAHHVDRYSIVDAVLPKPTIPKRVVNIASLAMFGFIVVSGAAFATIAVVPDWTQPNTADEFARVLVRIGYIPVVVTGLMA
jgi:hypothetical protein